LAIPSSFWITLSCSRRKNCRCCSVIFSSTERLILACNLATSISLRISTRTFSMRRRTSRVSSTACNSSLSAVVNVAAKSASAEGSFGLKRLTKFFSSSL
jgi:hypothetical protein